MARILVYDVAASKGGAATVLQEFYERYSHDSGNEYFFVVSVIDLEPRSNVRIIKLPWVKRSWLHRLYCDNWYMPRLVRKLAADEVLSLQNIPLSLDSKIVQTVYLHNAIPFSKCDFSFTSDTKLWVYKHIIGRRILRKLKLADKVIVQTEWMKNAVIQKCGIPGEDIIVEPVNVSAPMDPGRVRPDKPILFYPASGESYKNHQCLLEALDLLTKKDSRDFELVLTIDKSDVRVLQMITAFGSLKDKVSMVGTLSRESMEHYYKRSVVVFPSYLETVGLPLIEAKLFGAEIIAADLEYAHEAIGDYSKVKWFDNKKPAELCEMIQLTLNELSD